MKLTPEQKDTKAFLTGSHAYGTPHERSDIDLVVLCDEETQLKLRSLANQDNGQIRFGSIQVIAFTNEAVFSAWKTINDQLVARKPVGRDEAVRCFRSGIGPLLDELYREHRT